MSDRPKSSVYERCVAAWAIEEFDFVDITVTANAKVRGHISGSRVKSMSYWRIEPPAILKDA